MRFSRRMRLWDLYESAAYHKTEWIGDRLTVLPVRGAQRTLPSTQQQANHRLLPLLKR
jgi:hypothetical protein